MLLLLRTLSVHTVSSPQPPSLSAPSTAAGQPSAPTAAPVLVQSVPTWLNPVLSGLTLTVVLGAVYNFALWRGGVDANLKLLQDEQVRQAQQLEKVSAQLQDLRDRVIVLQAQSQTTGASAQPRKSDSNSGIKPR